MNMPQQPQSTIKHFLPNPQFCIAFVFGVGVIACFVLLVAAVVAAAMILNLAMQTLCDLAANIHQLYGSSDSFTRLLIIGIVVYVFARLARAAYHSFRSKPYGGIA